MIIDLLPLGISGMIIPPFFGCASIFRLLHSLRIVRPIIGIQFEHSDDRRY
jgi:hypothetical protein